VKNGEDFPVTQNSDNNQIVRLETRTRGDKKPSPGQPIFNTPAQIIHWPVDGHFCNEELPAMDTPSPENSLQILAHAPMGIIITDDAGLVLWCNDTMAQWTGINKADCVGRTESGLLQSDNLAYIPGSNGPYKIGSSDNERHVMRCTQSLADDQKTIYYLDVTDEEKLRNERNQLAKLLDQHNTVDPVSGLLNHRGIVKGLDPLVSRSRRYENPLSVVTMTVNNLGDVEKTYGHTAVDKITLVISQLLRDQLRWADLVGRDDSGDFVFVLPETDKEAAVSLANKIADQLNQLDIPVDGEHTSKPQACFGVVSWTRGDDSAQLLKRASNAASTASQQGAFSVEAA